MQLQIIESIRAVSTADHNLDIKPVKNMPNTFRLRVGSYRILFYQEDEAKCITIWRVSHRSAAYRGL